MEDSLLANNYQNTTTIGKVAEERLKQKHDGERTQDSPGREHDGRG